MEICVESCEQCGKFVTFLTPVHVISSSGTFWMNLLLCQLALLLHISALPACLRIQFSSFCSHAPTSVCSQLQSRGFVPATAETRAKAVIFRKQRTKSAPSLTQQEYSSCTQAEVECCFPGQVGACKPNQKPCPDLTTQNFTDNLPCSQLKGARANNGNSTLPKPPVSLASNRPSRALSSPAAL